MNPVAQTLLGWTEHDARGQLLSDVFQVVHPHTGEVIENPTTQVLREDTAVELPHRSILQHVWGSEYGDEAEYLRVYMRKLRQKIESDPMKPKYLHTEHGIGYRFEG